MERKYKKIKWEKIISKNSNLASGVKIGKGSMIISGSTINVGTIIGNPWTFPFFYFLAYKIGIFFYFEPLLYYEFKISFFINNFEKLFYPTLFGSIPIAIIIWLGTYYLGKHFLQKRYEKKNKIRN